MTVLPVTKIEAVGDPLAEEVGCGPMPSGRNAARPGGSRGPGSSPRGTAGTAGPSADPPRRGRTAPGDSTTPGPTARTVVVSPCARTSEGAIAAEGVGQRDQGPARRLGERLAGAHQVEVDVGRQVEIGQGPVERPRCWPVVTSRTASRRDRRRARTIGAILTASGRVPDDAGHHALAGCVHASHVPLRPSRRSVVAAGVWPGDAFRSTRDAGKSDNVP